MFFPTVRADSAPFWGPNAVNPTVKVISENQFSPHDGEYCRPQNFTFTIAVEDGWFSWKWVERTYSQCAFTTAFGTETTNGTLQFKNDPKAYHLEVDSWPVQVPNAKSLFFLDGELIAYDNPLQNFTTGQGSSSDYDRRNYKQEYVPKPGVEPRVLLDSRGDEVDMDEVDASPNGEWLIADAGRGDRLLRINPDTFEFLVFPGGVKKYNPFSDPNVDMAISNDGRYAAMAGGYGVTFKLYDLSTCVPDPEYNVHEATGCDPKKSSVTENYLSEQLGGQVTSVSQLQFNDDGTQLYATVSVEDDQGNSDIKRVALIASGHEYTQLAYLALGDSYSSGEGDTEKNPVTGEKYYVPGTDVEADDEGAITREKCHLSSRSYPYRLASRMGLIDDMFASVACSGAVINDVNAFDSNYLGQPDYIDELYYKGRLALLNDQQTTNAKSTALDRFIPGRISQLKFIERYNPKALTFTIGGNDAGFGDVIRSCVTNFDIFGPCDWAVNDNRKKELGKRIQEAGRKLTGLYSQIKRESQGAKIYAVGYPMFIKTGERDCPLNVRLNEAERHMVSQGVQYMNRYIEYAATKTGIKYIDVQNSLEGYELCGDSDGPKVTGVAFAGASEQQESMHPNARGHAALANTIASTVAPSLLAYDDFEEANPSAQEPEMPAFFNPSEADYNWSPLRYILSPGLFITAHNNPVNIQAEDLPPLSEVNLGISSDLVDLGTYTTDENGVLNANVVLPSSIKPGFHTLHAYTTSMSGQPIDLYQPIEVQYSTEDIDGDGTINKNDPCNFVKPANVDEDRDGIDDACDSTMAEPPLPRAPTVVVPEIVNTVNANSVTVYGKGEANTTAYVLVDDENPETEPVTSRTKVVNNEDSGIFSYKEEVNLSSLDDGILTVIVHLENYIGAGPEVTTTITKDTLLPKTSVSQNPVLNSGGWHKETVTIILEASDEGTGVKHLTYSASGATTIPQVTADSIASFEVAAEGKTIVTYHAADLAGNVEEKQMLVIRIDKTAPITSVNRPKPPVLLGLFNDALTGITTDNVSNIVSTEVTFTNFFARTRAILPARCIGGCGTRNTYWAVQPANSLPSGIYKVKAHSVDAAGNKGRTSEAKWVIIVNWLKLYYW